VRRLPETLQTQHRRPFTKASVIAAGKAVLSNRQTMCFTAAMMFLFGVMTGYVASSELILEDVYGYGDYFPVFFGGVGVLLAVSSLNNARLVGRVGVTVLVRRMAVVGVAMAAVLTAVSMINGGRPNFWMFTFLVAITVPLAQGLIPSSNTAAMTPLPHVAGTASAIIATITTAGGALLGNLVTTVFDGTVRPFAVCMLIFMSISAVLILFGATTRSQAATRVDA
jgi:DHA1 family bicyclomycin/chloramphenicol resistance-like MFS transporter